MKGRSCPVCGYSGGRGNNTGNALKRGTKLGGRYKIGGVIGSGGFGITYMAYDLKNNTTAAVKEYFPRLIAIRTENGLVCPSAEKHAEIYKRGTEEFYHEAEYVFQFNGNPNIISVSDYFYENNTSYIVMEYLSGITLENYIKKYGSLSDGQIVYIAEKILMALISVHSAQLLHRDISPDNIMLCADGKVKLIDFGAARILTAEGLNDFTVVIKKGFTPAEQYMCGGSFGEWTDIYSFGAVLYYAAAGKIPENPYERMINDGGLDFGCKPTDKALREVIGKALSISATKRYENAAEMKNAISELKIKGTEIRLPEDFDPLKAKSFSATAPMGYSDKRRSKWLMPCTMTVLTVSAFIAGMCVNGGTAAKTLPTAEMGNISFTRNEDTVKIDFDGEFNENFEYDGAIPVSLLKSFDGDVEIIYNFEPVPDRASQTAGLIPADSGGNYLIKYITGDYIYAQAHGWVNIEEGADSFSFTLSREGIESLGDNDFGIYNYNLVLKSAEIKAGSKQNPVFYYSYVLGTDCLEPMIFEENGEKIVDIDFTGEDTKLYPTEWGGFITCAVPKSAFDELDGDILVTLEIEHTNTEDDLHHIFYIYECGMNPKPVSKSVILSEAKDKFGNYLTAPIYDGISVSEDITECSFMIPREAADSILGGIQFGMDHLLIKRARLESVDGSTAAEPLPSAETENISFTRNEDTVKIDFDGKFRDAYEYCGAVPVSLLESFGGDVKITVDFDRDPEGLATGFIPTDGSGKCVIEYLSTEMYPWAEENGWIFVNSNDLHYDLTISREGIEKLQGDSFGFEAYGLAVKSVTLEKGEKIGGYYFHDYSKYNAPTVKSTNSDGSTVITADIAGNYIAHDDVDFNWASVPKSAFLEFDGDVLMTLEIEHSDNESQCFRICTNGGAWDALDGRLVLTEIVDYKNEEVLFCYAGGECGYLIHADAGISECSVTVPHEAVEKISGGVFFQPMGIEVKSVRLESADREAENGNTSD